MRKINRVLNNIKRGVCEIAIVQGDSIRSGRRSRVSCRVLPDGLQEIAKADMMGNIAWVEKVEEKIRLHVYTLLPF